MKILFLDFDGVLNCERYVRNSKNFGLIIDPVRMKYLKSIIEATDAEIVLTTSWREHWDTEDALCDETGKYINKLFNEFGLKIKDKTPYSGDGRENDIKIWLESNQGTTSFAVIDDAFLSADFLRDHFIRTSNIRNGLELTDVEKIIKILNHS